MKDIRDKSLAMAVYFSSKRISIFAAKAAEVKKRAGRGIGARERRKKVCCGKVLSAPCGHRRFSQVKPHHDSSMSELPGNGVNEFVGQRRPAPELDAQIAEAPWPGAAPLCQESLLAA